MRILIVEDEPTLCAQLRIALEEQGYAVDIANNGEDGLHMGKEEAFDVAILDLGLPKLDGISVLKGWRLARKKLPVIILTARDNWSEKVSGIDAGADDYLTKPFHMEELLARIRSVIRRTAGHSSPVLSIKGLRLDTRSSKVSLDGNPITLTAHEFKLLEYLMHHPNEVIDRATLGGHIYAYNEDPDSNTIEVFIARLRKKIPEGLIETIRGLGYRLNDDL
ncbi:response regulator transcription factor [Polynucleobacter sp.]|uniref:response regulator transcription factor n=1 Tax=Polynucleobacter sp. TaxID=2029855 RepID=UPI0027364F60|nr:response regulator transcription factor [Polynucleobacter sp.]MDP3121836.1 response regulator transcription factor [Polynucleobacter sp.]